MSEYSFFADPTMGGAFPSTSTSSSVRKSPINWQSATVEELLRYSMSLTSESRLSPFSASFWLIKKRVTEEELALSLWNSFNTTYLLISEVTSIYHLLTPDKLTTRDSTRVCNAIALLQCMASHPDTKMEFLNVKTPHYLYPFLKTTETGRPFQYLRLTSLGAIAALVKNDDAIVPKAVHFYLKQKWACDALRRILPPQLRSTAFINAVRDDIGTLQKLKQLFYNVTTGHWATTEPIGDVINAIQNLRIDDQQK